MSPIPGLSLILNGWPIRGARYLVLCAVLVVGALSPLTAETSWDRVLSGTVALWMLLAMVSHLEGVAGYSRLWVNFDIICGAAASPLGSRAHRCPRCRAQADASGWCPGCLALLRPSARAEALARTWASAFNAEKHRVQARTMRYPVRHHSNDQSELIRVRRYEDRVNFHMIFIAFPDARESQPRGFQDPDDPEIVWVQGYMHATDPGSGAPFCVLSTNRVRLQEGRVTDVWGATALVSVGSPTSPDTDQMLKFGSVRPAPSAVDQPRRASIAPPTR